MRFERVEMNCSKEWEYFSVPAKLRLPELSCQQNIVPERELLVVCGVFLWNFIKEQDGFSHILADYLVITQELQLFSNCFFISFMDRYLNEILYL